MWYSSTGGYVDVKFNYELKKVIEFNFSSLDKKGKKIYILAKKKIKKYI